MCDSQSTSCSHLDHVCKRQVACTYDYSHTQQKTPLPHSCHRGRTKHLARCKFATTMPCQSVSWMHPLLPLTAANSPITSPTTCPKCPAPTADSPSLLLQQSFGSQNSGCCNGCSSLPAAAGRVAHNHTCRWSACRTGKHGRHRQAPRHPKQSCTQQAQPCEKNSAFMRHCRTAPSHSPTTPLGPSTTMQGHQALQAQACAPPQHTRSVARL